MKLPRPGVVAILVSVGLCIPACQKRANFVHFLSQEVGALGGKTNSLATANVLLGRWKVRHDQFGAAIDTDGINFAAISNTLTSVYGIPQFYTRANNRHGPTYLYTPSNAGISIFVSATKDGAEVTLLKPDLLQQRGK